MAATSSRGGQSLRSCPPFLPFLPFPPFPPFLPWTGTQESDMARDRTMSLREVRDRTALLNRRHACRAAVNGSVGAAPAVSWKTVKALFVAKPRVPVELKRLPESAVA